MRLASYAKRSSYGEQAWLKAEAELEHAGFDEKERQAVLDSAFKNRRDPRRHAEVAIRLRRHVEAGSPLS